MCGECSTVIVNQSLGPAGEIKFRYLVAVPFSHPNMSKSLKDTYWKSTVLIGHRGGGADSSSKSGKYHRTHIQENTILSFVTAASLGAEYVGKKNSKRHSHHFRIRRAADQRWCPSDISRFLHTLA